MNEIVTITREYSIDAAHQLPQHAGKCHNLHGHTYRIEVRITGRVDPTTGMVVDFAELDGAMSTLLENWDHHYLNDLPEFIGLEPTAENMAIIVVNWVETRLGYLGSRGLTPGENCFGITARVWETPKCSALYTRFYSEDGTLTFVGR